MKTRFLLFSLLLAGIVAPAAAQEVSLGSDVMSRYVWRGVDYGESLSLQPSLSVSYKGFELGTWAAYSVSANGAGVNEHDLWLSYSVETATAGSFSLGVTDYYFPAPGAVGFFDFEKDGEGAHWIEPFVSYTGPESAPVTLSAYYMAHNDPDNSLYINASYPAQVKDVALNFAIGAVSGTSAFYGTTDASIVELIVSASKDVAITESFSLPISVSYILNPEIERTYLVFGISL